METIIKRKRGGVPIEEHRLICLKCGYDHVNTSIIRQYKKNGTGTMHYICDECKYPLRMTTTRRGFYVFSNQAKYNYITKKWNDVLMHAPFKVTIEMHDWFSDNYDPPRKKLDKNQ
jgi:hypothetical protein